MAVIPAFQKQGVGSELIKKGIAKAKELGFDSIIVLGHKDYYPKFGFERASKWNIKCPSCKSDATPIPVSEETELKCNSIYSITKKNQEEIALFLGKLYDLPVTILRYFNVFGPNEYHKANMRSFILKAFEQITEDGKVRLFKSCNYEYADGEYKQQIL